MSKINIEAYSHRLIKADYYSRAATLLSAAVSVASVVASVVAFDSPNVRRAANLMAIGSGYASLITSSINSQLRFEQNDALDIESTLGQNAQYLARRAELLPGKGIIGETDFSEMNDSAVALEWLDWSKVLIDRAKVPHLMIAAPSGAGKSSLAIALAELLQGVNIVVDPHYKPGNYSSVDLIIGRKRNLGCFAGEPYEKNIGTKKEPEFIIVGEPVIKFDLFLEAIAKAEPNLPAFSNASVAQFLYSLHQEMVRRFDLRDKGSTDFEPINIILDEMLLLPAIEGFKEVFASLLREARKVDIRLICLVQGTEVKSLGIEGEGSIRDQLRFIRLGSFADEHLRLLAKKDKRYQPVLAQVQRMERYAMFDDAPAALDIVQAKHHAL